MTFAWREPPAALLAQHFHIPSDLVVDSCPQMSRAAQPLISRWYLMCGRQTSRELRPIISMG